MDFFLRYFSHISVSVEMCDVDSLVLLVLIDMLAVFMLFSLLVCDR